MIRGKRLGKKQRIRALAAFAAGAMACAGLLASPSRAETTAARPERIVSLNLCVDQILLDLVPRDRIKALSFLATDPSMSLMHREAAGIATVRGHAEEVLGLNPDLILAGEFTTSATVELLRRLGRRVEILPMASTFAGIRDLVRQLAALTGEAARGEALVAAFDARLAAVAAADGGGARLRAVAFQVNSLASGPGSLVDDVLRAAGFDNLAATARLGPGGRLPLESLVSDPPDVIVRANAARDFRTVLGDNLRHPAFKALEVDRPSVHMPMSEWLCGTTRIVQAVERLAGARATIAKRPAPPPAMKPQATALPAIVPQAAAAGHPAASVRAQ